MLVNIPIIKSTCPRDWQVLLQMQSMLYVCMFTCTSVVTPMRASCTESAAECRVIRRERLVKLEALAKHLTRRLQPGAVGRRRGLWKLEHMVGNWRRPNQTHYTGDTKERKNSHHSRPHPQGQTAKLLHLITLAKGRRSSASSTGNCIAFLAFPVGAAFEARPSSGLRPRACTSVIHS